jgi:hypothetical protein
MGFEDFSWAFNIDQPPWWKRLLRRAHCAYSGHAFGRLTGLCLRCGGHRITVSKWQVQALLPPLFRFGGGLRIIRFSGKKGEWVHTMYRLPTMQVTHFDGMLHIRLTWFQRSSAAYMTEFKRIWEHFLHPHTRYRPW